MYIAHAHTYMEYVDVSTCKVDEWNGSKGEERFLCDMFCLMWMVLSYLHSSLISVSSTICSPLPLCDLNSRLSWLLFVTIHQCRPCPYFSYVSLLLLFIFICHLFNFAAYNSDNISIVCIWLSVMSVSILHRVKFSLSILVFKMLFTLTVCYSDITLLSLAEAYLHTENNENYALPLQSLVLTVFNQACEVSEGCPPILHYSSI